jgi:MFS family permease
LVAALGFGWTVGPLLASALFKWRNITGALLITGILTPLTALTIAFIPNISGVLIALATSSIAGAALNVMVTTILLRLTPANRQGHVVGTMQTLSGLMWSLSAVIITAVVSFLPQGSNPQFLFSIIGTIGALMVLACWMPVRRQNHPDSEMNRENLILEKPASQKNVPTEYSTFTPVMGDPSQLKR